MKLMFIHCEQCNGMYLVAIDGKVIAGLGSHGRVFGGGYLAIGNEELRDVPETVQEGDRYPCPKCEIDCIVGVGKEIDDHGIMSSNE